jgi:chitin disaccharide deacetylase
VRRLIINADDFGLTAGVNRAVMELHLSGLLTSATLMAKAGAREEAFEMAASARLLGVGTHIVLVDGVPALPVSEIKSLIDRRTGEFFRSLSGFLARLLSGRIAAAEVEAEAAAQISLLQRRGLRVTHVDTHKHTHMFPGVLRPVLHAAKAAGIHAVRNPFEPSWSLRATEGASLKRRLEVEVLRRMESRFRRIVAEEGFVTTDGAIGVLATGTLDERALLSLLTAMPNGTFELVTHPGYLDDELARVRTRLVGSRDVEREALAVVREFPGIDLISFADLAKKALAGDRDSSSD